MKKLDPKKWSPIGYVDEAMVEVGFNKCMAAANGNETLMSSLMLERRGGPCPLCGVPYAEVKVDNQFGKFTFYQPACYCFKKCNECSRFMVNETRLDIDYCTECHPRGIERKEVKRNRSRGRRVSGKDAAAGEEEREE